MNNKWCCHDKPKLITMFFGKMLCCKSTVLLIPGSGSKGAPKMRIHSHNRCSFLLICLKFPHLRRSWGSRSRAVRDSACCHTSTRPASCGQTGTRRSIRPQYAAHNDYNQGRTPRRRRCRGLYFIFNPPPPRGEGGNDCPFCPSLGGKKMSMCQCRTRVFKRK